MSLVKHGYFRMRIVSRSDDHSIVQRAAFNSGAALVDRARCCTWDHRLEHEVYDCFVMAPSDAPSWALEREDLWNAVERTETRVDAQLGRELELSLPEWLTLAKQVELLRTFVGDHFVRRGMVADCVIRSPTPPKRHRPGVHPVPGPWALVLLTTRELHSSGFGRKQRSWNDRDLKKVTRTEWQEMANRALADAGREERIDMTRRAPLTVRHGAQAGR